MAKIGYARVSTIDQDFEIQQQRLYAQGYVIVR
ncbi:DNA invertase Pin-like site-specific DNA recombinase [Rhizobium leguminosarum]